MPKVSAVHVHLLLPHIVVYVVVLAYKLTFLPDASGCIPWVQHKVLGASGDGDQSVADSMIMVPPKQPYGYLISIQC